MRAMPTLGESTLLDVEAGCAPRFHESWTDRLRRLVLGVGYALKPSRISLVPLLGLMTLEYLAAPKPERDQLPDMPKFVSKHGFVGISDDLSVDALLANYARGFFPVCHIGPMKWWCPAERAVLDPADVHVSKNTKRLLRQHKFDVSMDRDFAGVMEACARPREGKVPLTWITPQIMHAYWKAHEAGYAHSVEVWDKSGHLVGGAYGLAIGHVYFGESRFSAARDASKVAEAVLLRQLSAWGYRLYDAKHMTSHLAASGFQPIPRDEFRSLLKWYLDEPGRLGRWELDPALLDGAQEARATAPSVPPRVA